MLDYGWDLAAIGEGEATILALVPALRDGAALTGVPGLAVRDDDGVAPRRLAEARGQLPSVLIRGWVLERLRQETTGEELLVSRGELARIVREQVEAVLRRAS